MKELKKLIQEQNYIEAKLWIIENRERIDELADCLLEMIERARASRSRKVFNNIVGMTDGESKSWDNSDASIKDDIEHAKELANGSKQFLINALSSIEGVKNVEILENPERYEIECIVDGGNDYAIASCIYDNTPVICMPVGTVSVDISDMIGELHTRRFSRPGNTLADQEKRKNKMMCFSTPYQEGDLHDMLSEKPAWKVVNESSGNFDVDEIRVSITDDNGCEHKITGYKEEGGNVKYNIPWVNKYNKFGTIELPTAKESLEAARKTAERMCPGFDKKEDYEIRKAPVKYANAAFYRDDVGECNIKYEYTCCTTSGLVKMTKNQFEKNKKNGIELTEWEIDSDGNYLVDFSASKYI